jgi:hypothetical protein
MGKERRESVVECARLAAALERRIDRRHRYYWHLGGYKR